MTFQQITTIPIQRDYHREDSNTLLTEVVVVDRTHKDLTFPLVYQVKGAHLSANELNDELRLHSGDLFVMVGEAVSIDREHKKIRLATENYVLYQHMIIIENPSNSYHTADVSRFAAGLQILVDAVRLKGRFPHVESSRQTRQHAHPAMELSVPRKSAFSASPKKGTDHLDVVTALQPASSSSTTAEFVYEIHL